MLSVPLHRKERTKRSLCMDFSRFLLVSFFLTDSIVYTFTVINLSHYIPYMLSPSNESSNVGVVLGSPNTRLNFFLVISP